jgi:hypothetical protein
MEVALGFTMSARLVAAGSIAMVAFAGAAAAQSPIRVRGTIEQVDGLTLTVTIRDGAPAKIVLADTVTVVAVTKRSLADIKPGEFVGSAAMMQPGGTWKALEVHIFPESMRGTGEGHRPWELPQSSMTNATVVDTVSKVDGHVMTLRYNGGEQRIEIADGIPIVGYVAGDKADLQPGKAFTIFSATKAEDGTLRAGRITVERTAKPPT